MSSHSHRPTLKQQNKSFKPKSGHASKGSLKEAAKGRLGPPAPSVASTSSSKSRGTNNSVDQARLARRNTTKQIQKQKRDEIVSSKRFFGGRNGVPRVVTVIELGEGTDSRRCIRQLVSALGEEDSIPSDEEFAAQGHLNISAQRFKTSLQFLMPPKGHFYSTLDCAKASDYIILLMSDETDVDAWGENLLRCLQSQGVCEIIGVVQSPQPTTTQPASGTLKSLLSFLRYFFPSQNRIYNTSTSSDASVTVRALCEGIPKDITWRENRAWVVAESLSYEPVEEASGTLVLKGWVRGGHLSANRLIHIPNYGDFQISKIIAAPASTSSSHHTNPNQRDPEMGEATILEEPTEDADDLVSTLDADIMANEQTWPSEEEMRGAEGAEAGERIPDAKVGTTPKIIRKVPKGTSTYQAAWIIDEDDGEDEDEDEEEEGEMKVDDSAEAGLGAVMEESEEQEEIELESRQGEVFNDLDDEEEEAQLQKYREEREMAREEEDNTDLHFPDEVDTPRNIPASTRFQRYRGLRSFRTSPWDPYENLPLDYGKIFQFENWKATERRVETSGRLEGVSSGTRVEVHIKAVPKSLIEAHKSVMPFFIFGLLEYEHKSSVLHFTIQRNTEFNEPVKSKDPLVMCVGPRRYRINPIYSQHIRGGGKGANNVHKFEKFLRPGGASVATIYGSVIFGKQPVMLLKENEEDLQNPSLVAMGSFLNADPTRINAKRIILTGHPFKIHKKTATIRYMFFNQDDVHYFKPIQLHTKYGATGHIAESLGTHGYFKAHFDGVINQQDTVCMSLYKRSYPRWAKLFVLGEEAAGATGEEDNEMAMEE